MTMHREIVVLRGVRDIAIMIYQNHDGWRWDAFFADERKPRYSGWIAAESYSKALDHAVKFILSALERA